MNDNNDRIEVSAVPSATAYEYVDAGPPAAAPPQQQAGANPLLVVHSLLRGRYHWAALLGVLLAAAGAVVGYKAMPLNYRSSGILEIKPNRERVVYQSDQNGLMPMFESFIESQSQLISSPTVLQDAMTREAWTALKREPTQKMIAQFRDSVEVEHPRNTQLLIVSFTDKNPAAAQAGAKSVIEAYKAKFWGGESADGAGNALGTLGNLKAEKRNKIDALQREMIKVGSVGKYQTDSLDPVYASKLQQYQTVAAEKLQVDVLLAAVKGRDEFIKSTSTTRSASSSSPATRPARRRELTADEIGTSDPELQAMVARRREAAANLERLKGIYGERWRSVLEAQDALSRLDTEIAERVEHDNRILEAASSSSTASSAGGPADGFGAGGGAGPGGKMSLVESLQMRAENVKELYNKTFEELTGIGGDNFKLKELRAQLDMATIEYNTILRRIDELSTESRSADTRLVLRSEPEEPITTYKDKRVTVSAACGFGGGVMGVALVAGFGLLNRRFRTLSDARLAFDPSVRVLGVLPHLETKDAEEVATAAHCLHHIRTSLQIYPDRADERAFAITSPSPGAGKTSLTLALGLSFSAARSRTLMIDCDILGGGLSAKVRRGRVRPLGQVLLREGVVDQEAVRQGLKYGRDHKVRLGEALVRLKKVTQADVDRGLETQLDSRVGLLDVLSGTALEDCVMSLGVPGLSVLPLGDATAAHIAQLSPRAMRRIIESARESYDTILIDTGPLSGSLEASVVCSEADKVVVVLPKGESYSLAKGVLERINSSRFRMAGVVFNRATMDDLEMSGYSSSRSQGSGSWPRPALGVRTIPFGDDVKHDSIASAVASSTAAGE